MTTLFVSHAQADATCAETIRQGLEAQGYTVERRRIQLDEPLKTVGEFHVPVRLFREVTAHVQVNVKSDQPDQPPVAESQAEAAQA